MLNRLLSYWSTIHWLTKVINIWLLEHNILYPIEYLRISWLPYPSQLLLSTAQVGQLNQFLDSVEYSPVGVSEGNLYVLHLQINTIDKAKVYL